MVDETVGLAIPLALVIVSASYATSDDVKVHYSIIIKIRNIYSNAVG